MCANELSEPEEFYYDLHSADIVQKYPNFLTYINTVYEDKDGWALPYRKTSLTRGNHTNNTVESQFLVFKDTLLQLVKEYNTNSLFNKFTYELGANGTLSKQTTISRIWIVRRTLFSPI